MNQRPKILFVDDEESITTMAKRLLEKMGYQVTVFSSSLEALKAFKADPAQFDIVFTDQTMPDMPGTELADRLLRIRPDLPIILCTGFSSMIKEGDFKDVGFSGFLSKPYTKMELSRVLGEVFNHHRDQQQDH